MHQLLDRRDLEARRVDRGVDALVGRFGTLGTLAMRTPSGPISMRSCERSADLDPDAHHPAPTGEARSDCTTVR